MSRWCRRHNAMRLFGVVGPWGQGVTWSRSQKVVEMAQPGKRQVLSRNAMNRRIAAGMR